MDIVFQNSDVDAYELSILAKSHPAFRKQLLGLAPSGLTLLSLFCKRWIDCCRRDFASRRLYTEGLSTVIGQTIEEISILSPLTQQRHIVGFHFIVRLQQTQPVEDQMASLGDIFSKLPKICRAKLAITLENTKKRSAICPGPWLSPAERSRCQATYVKVRTSYSEMRL